MSAAARAKANATKPGSAWGSRNVPDVKKYELPSKVKPKVKEETKKKLAEGSKLGKIKKEEEHKKEKNPPIPSHKIVKKPVTGEAVEGQENTAVNK